jgi:hypothetical protein
LPTPPRTAGSADERDEFLDGDLGGPDYAAEGAAVELGVQRYGDGRSAGAFQTDVAALLSQLLVAKFGEGSDARRARDDREGRQGSSSGDVDVDDLVLGRQDPALLSLRLEAQLDRLTDVDEGFFLIFALADAAGDQRTFGDYPAVFARRQHHRQLHEFHVTTATLAVPEDRSGARLAAWRARRKPPYRNRLPRSDHRATDA